MADKNSICKILLVEDDPQVRVSIATYLCDMGFEVIEAEDGKAGLEAFQKENPDIVLVDLRMPVMDGFELLSILTVESPETPLVVVSGTGDINDAIEAIRKGAWDYVLKPIEDMQVLSLAMDKALERSMLLRENKRYQDELEVLVRERTSELQNEVNERRSVEMELRSSEKRYRTLIDTAGEGVWVVDIDANTTFVNHQMADMLGYTEEEMIGRPIYYFLDDDNKILLQNKLVNRISGQGEQYDLQICHKGGSKISCIMNASPLYDSTGRMTGSFAMVTDVTERQQLLSQLQQAQRMEAIGTLAGGIAHDFNNILGAIIGYADLIRLDYPADNVRNQRFLDGVKKAANRAKKLVQQILTFSRQTQEEHKPVILRLIVKESLKFLRASIPSTIEIRQNMEDNDSVVVGDPTQMHQVLMNLCTNAAQAMGSEGGVLEVSLNDMEIDSMPDDPVLEGRCGSYVRLVVSDTGSGIDPENMDRIFDPFFTTKNPGEGTGMGLSVVHGIVHSHGGVVRVDSNPEQGTKFEILFPREEKTLIEKEPRETTEMEYGSETVLVVDDEADIADILEKTLVKFGYSVEARSSSVEALELFKSGPDNFDLVLTDMTMPEMTGITLARKILAIRPDIPVLLCSGFCDEYTTAEARSVGIREILHKPLGIINLADVVRRVLNEKERV